MIFKLSVLRRMYWRDPWNCVDCTISCLSILDTWILSIAAGSGNGQELVPLRLFRLVRVVRMVRVLKLHRELVLIIKALAAALRSVGWVSLMLFVVIYVSAIFCVEIIGRTEYPASVASYGFDNVEFFGSLSQAMLSLLGMAFLAEWVEVIRPVYEQQPLVVVFFLLFIVVTTFGLMNVIIGVIVESQEEVAEEERERKRMEDKLDRMDMVTTLSRIWDAFEDENRPISKLELTSQDFSREFGDDIYKALVGVELPYGFQLCELHDLLDCNADDLLSQDEFRNGMYRLIFADNFQNGCLLQLFTQEIKNDLIVCRNYALELQQQAQFMIKRLVDEQFRFSL